jgi:hypothetical protein
VALVNDKMFAALRGLGFTGAVPDMLLEYYQANGATSPALPDAEREFLLAVYPAGTSKQVSDLWFGYLRSQGYTGSVSDMLLQYWTALAP